MLRMEKRKIDCGTVKHLSDRKPTALTRANGGLAIQARAVRAVRAGNDREGKRNPNFGMPSLLFDSRSICSKALQ